MTRKSFNTMLKSITMVLLVFSLGFTQEYNQTNEMIVHRGEAKVPSDAPDSAIDSMVVVNTVGHNNALISTSGQSGIWRTQSAYSSGKKQLNFFFGVDYASRSPYVQSVTTASGTPRAEGSPLEYLRMEWDFAIGYGITDIVDVSLILPIYQDWLSVGSFSDTIGSSSLWPNDGENRYGAGDLEIAATVQLFRQKLESQYAFAYYGALSFPTGSNDDAYYPGRFYYQNKQGDIEGYYSSSVVEFENQLLFSFDFKQAEQELPIKLHTNAGVRIPFKKDTLEPIILLGVGVVVSPKPWMDIFTELTLENRASSYGSSQDFARDPITITPGIEVRTPGGVGVRVGADISLSQEGGYVYDAAPMGSSVGHSIETSVQPRLSLLAAVTWDISFGKDTTKYYKDSDKDGYFDYADSCPQDPEDFDQFEDSDGCPDPDNDGDQFLDVDDSCPNEPETVNGYADFDGCPDESPHIMPTKDGQAKVLYDVLFAFDSEKFESESQATLDSVAISMVEWPTITIEIAGYTDSIGANEYNQNLSKRRANTVKEYLVNRGVDENRIKVDGAGEATDWLDNSDNAGRQWNRHIQIRRTDIEVGEVKILDRKGTIEKRDAEDKESPQENQKKNKGRNP